jgi:hypothetical protein
MCASWFVVEELLTMSRDVPIVAEWFGLLRGRVAPLLSVPHRALWLIAVPAFLTSDPERETRNIQEVAAVVACHLGIKSP